MNTQFTADVLENLYLKEQKSTSDIAKALHCSENKITYWLKKFGIPKRSISEAIYLKKNPEGDPFRFRLPKTKEEAILFGMGIGLYWGEGTKANNNTVRLGNSDPKLIRMFMDFLVTFFAVNEEDFRYHLHIFTDIDINRARKYWMDELGMAETQFYKPTITRTGKLGTYRHKSEYGVLTIYYGNIKLRNKLIALVPM
ncbi:MAG: hypothetical protein UT41_C0001G0162 [Candidatus Wolfebacteria bacterium GW2011_GWC2_39_22]|uniref:Homing endonuclease LAGLIDADG domain-containing protein n=1 Tax=Candidatus Wolfebacteria bacterium GW2011_GWC2_39_22 TaxID=1619013 RepID=A0A0G0NAZ8_9BACT|nr:MAG: hypothetical protein UT41_C0001G0162 [Candidatus Wolfebacteria bacterium GW2011_GWC2_39_22]HBI25820.1 hypothetical protein [Candidatus Wolfebacteria bacterium]